MSLNFNYYSSYPKNERFFSNDFIESKKEQFLGTINNPDFGFFKIIENQSLLDSCKKVKEQFSHINHFVQVGIGGSSLGPEMIVSALKKNSEMKFTFINNVDPEEFAEQLSSFEIGKTLFYFVSKSGGTAETMASFAIITSHLLKNGISEQELNKHYVFATDPVKSQLLDLGKQLNITCLEVPSNVGGRYSVLTPVGYLPALFAHIDIDQMVAGAKDQANDILSSNKLFECASFIFNLKENKINQTVLMPYSSKLRDFSFWFVQLWAESLGKKLSLDGKVVEEGLTPIPSYGATDQHSQMQLFMEGPRDKLLFMLEVESFAQDFSLECPFDKPALKRLAPHSLAKLNKAELQGTLKALKEKERPFIHIAMSKNDEYHMGELIMFFESLTALMGHYLNIDPFDQPGVELGKVYAYEWLEK